MHSIKKVVLGQFFTKDQVWLRPHIAKFIQDSGCTCAYDPFAGAGHLLDAAQKHLNFHCVKGLDIDEKLFWEHNDSLENIPHVDNAIIITNPPYISNYSAARKKVDAPLQKYFDKSCYNDIYLIALDKMNAAQKYVVTIIPETFINSPYRQKALLHSVTILEENPFDDTDVPVLVACFDGCNKPLSEVQVYKNDTRINSLDNIEKLRLPCNKTLPMTFNAPDGWLAVRCVDTTNPNETLHFDFKRNIRYDWEHRIKVSSRLLTLIAVDIPPNLREPFVAECNRILQKIRIDTDDIILSPFKGNMKNGRRRRRLDFLTCRAIMEKAYSGIFSPQKRTIESCAQCDMAVTKSETL